MTAGTGVPHHGVRVVVEEGPVAVVQPSGELDLANIEQLDDALRAGLMCADELVVDLRAVSFVDVRTAHLLQDHAEKCASRGGRLRVHNALPAPRRALVLCGLGSLLT